MRTLSEHILDIVRNSVKAGASLIEIMVEEDKKNDLCLLTIRDNGCGMSPETLQRASDPFFTSRTTRKVGLGLSLLKQNAELSGGWFQLESEEGKGTCVKAAFGLSHVDRPPLGDIWETVYLTLLSFSDGNLVYTHRTHQGTFSISSEELKEVLGEVSIQQKEIRDGILELIRSNLEELEVTN